MSQRIVSASSTTSRRIFAATLALSLVGSLLSGPAVLALSNKKAGFQLPTCQKLGDAAGPSTAAEPALKPTKIDLTPLTLDSGNQTAAAQPQESQGDQGANAADAGVMKAVISTTTFVPKGPASPTSRPDLKSTSIARPSTSGINDKQQEKGATAYQQVNVMPLALIPTEDETQKQLDTVQEAEKTQLTELWESTLTRSPDIQFVVQKLMPTSNRGHATTIMMRMLSSALFGAMGAAQMIAPNQGTYMLNSMGAQMISQLLGMQESKHAKAQRLSQTEAIMLYDLVRRNADKLVEQYRQYKTNIKMLDHAATDFQDLQNILTDARKTTTKPQEIMEMEYTLRKMQRDVEKVQDELKRFRQCLVDLAGADAVAKLDAHLQEEKGQLQELPQVASPAVPTPAEISPPSSETTMPPEQLAGQNKPQL